MIDGLTHVAMTVGGMERSIALYERRLGMTTLSDAERKGEWIDKVTGIPGFHTRTVYLSVNPRQHLELFEFFNPSSIPRNSGKEWQVGIVGCILEYVGGQAFPSAFPRLTRGSRLSDLEGLLGESDQDSMRFVTVDPDGLEFGLQRSEQSPSTWACEKTGVVLCPIVVTREIERAKGFYRDILGLSVAAGGERPQRATGGKRVAWAVMRTPGGICLKLVQPLDENVQPLEGSKMEQIGFTHLAFSVSSMNKCFERLTAKGCRVKSSPQDIAVGPHEGGKVVYANCPEGVTLEFLASPLTSARDVGSEREA